MIGGNCTPTPGGAQHETSALSASRRQHGALRGALKP